MLIKGILLVLIFGCDSKEFNYHESLNRCVQCDRMDDSNNKNETKQKKNMKKQLSEGDVNVKIHVFNTSICE